MWGDTVKKTTRSTHGDTRVQPARPPLSRPRRATTRARRTTRAAFLQAYRRAGTLASAARQVHVSRGAHYRWLQQDPDYAAAFHEANEEVADTLETEARRRALEGVEEPVFYKGERIGSTRRYSDSLLILLLMAKRPDQFRERMDVTSTVDHGTVVIDPQILKTLTDAELHEARTMGRKLAGLKEKRAS